MLVFFSFSRKPWSRFVPSVLLCGLIAQLPLGAQGLAPATPAKEYIRLNGQAVAVEMAGTPAGTGSSSSGSGSTAGNSGSGSSTSGSSPLRFVPVAPCRVVETRLPNGPLGGPYLAGGSSRDFPLLSGSCNLPASAQAYSLNFTVVPNQSLGYLKAWPTGQPTPSAATVLSASDGRVKANAAVIAAGANGSISLSASNDTNVSIDINGYFTLDFSQASYYPVPPCRVADTRGSAGPLGGPYLAGGAARNFPVLSSACGLPGNASAYVLNVTAVPHGSLSYLTVWASWQPQPGTSTLNAPTGTVVANTAIVAPGTNGQIAVYASNDTDLVLDVVGYFATGAGGLSLYPTAPCRAFDTRTSGAGAPLNGQMMISLAGLCGLPATAGAYLFNAAVIPYGALTDLQLWDDGAAQPIPAVLNAPDGAVTSNLALTASSDGSLDGYATNATHLILDSFGYFTQPYSLAQGRPATQSSTYAPNTGPGNAVDGNTDGNYQLSEITHTNYEANAWWQVDLGASQILQAVQIWNRTDCCSSRLSDYWIFVSDTPFTSSDTPSSLAGRTDVWSSHQTTMPNPSLLIAAEGVRGRYVRVQLNNTDYLSLAEVQVFGFPVPPSLAQGKPATQSSTFQSNTPAGNAVDGNTDGNYWDGSLSHTNADPNAWWQVDLGASQPVHSVQIWNRTDCCSNRLSDYWIFVSNTPFNSSDTPSTLAGRAGVWGSHQTTMPNPSLNVPVGGVWGRYLRIQLSGTDYLSLAEVQVY